MISKVITGRSFSGCCRYVCQDQKRSIVLECEGVRGYNYKLMAKDFEMQQQLRPSKQKAVLHAILSFYPGEDVSDKRMVEIAKAYLQRAGVTETQYSITKHIDKEHLHMHVIANLVNNNGKAITDSWLGARAKRVSQELTKEFKLVQSLQKNLALTNLESLSEYERIKYKIYEAVRKNISECKDFEELRSKLEKQSIKMNLKYSSQLKQLQGIGFRMEGYSYKGSAVDREFSAKRIERKLEQNFKMEISQKVKQEMKHDKKQERDVIQEYREELIQKERHRESHRQRIRW